MQISTRASQFENGIPLSLAKAKSCLDVEAYVLVVMKISSRSTTVVRPVAPATEPVAFWNT